MSVDEGKTTRRRFIIRSAFAAGAVGTSLYVSRRGYAVDRQKGNPADFRVTRRYPWYADVNAAGQATMYLLQDMHLDHLLDRVDDAGGVEKILPLAGLTHGVINHMLNRADPLARLHTSTSNPGKEDLEEAAAEMTRAINETEGLRYPLTELTNRLDAVIAAVLAVQDAKKDWSYVDYAKAPDTDWPADVKTALERLGKLISVPLLNMKGYNAQVEHCFQAVPVDFRGKKLEELFVSQWNDGIFRTNEVTYWNRNRNLGLLWCAPRTLKADCTPEVQIRPPITTPDSRLATANSRYCDTTNYTCKPGTPDQYCQEVDGICSAISHP